MKCRTNVINVLSPSVRNFHVVLQSSIDSVYKHDADMSNDDKEKQDPTDEKRDVTVSRNRNTR